MIQFGAFPTSRATQGFVAGADQLVVADRWHLDPNPDRLPAWRLAVDPDALIGALGDIRWCREASGSRSRASIDRGEIEELLAGTDRPGAGRLDRDWRAFDELARTTMDRLLDGWEEPFEPRIARDVAAWIPDGRAACSSGTPRPSATSTSRWRRAAASRSWPTAGRAGSTGSSRRPSASPPRGATRPWRCSAICRSYDAGALLWNASRDVDLTIVVVNNHGGVRCSRSSRSASCPSTASCS